MREKYKKYIFIWGIYECIFSELNFSVKYLWHKRLFKMYKGDIANKPNYTLASIYADEGISGVNTSKCEQFKK